jgi:hypothetical protein
LEPIVLTGAKGNKYRQGQNQQDFAFYLRLNQIPDDYHQIAVKFRRVNGIRDGQREQRTKKVLPYIANRFNSLSGGSSTSNIL